MAGGQFLGFTVQGSAPAVIGLLNGFLGSGPTRSTSCLCIVINRVQKRRCYSNKRANEREIGTLEAVLATTKCKYEYLQ